MKNITGKPSEAECVVLDVAHCVSGITYHPVVRIRDHLSPCGDGVGGKEMLTM